jgi:ClpP class serine protease
MDKIGVNTDGVARGANSGLLSPFDGFNASERKAMQTMMEEIYDQFLTKALEGRKAAGKPMTYEKLKTLAEGRIWTGRQALENGLIDVLGGLDDAIGEAKVQGGLAREAGVDYLILPKPQSVLDSLLDRGVGAEMRMLLATHPELLNQLRAIEPLMSSREHVWLMAPGVTQIR